MQEIVEIVNIWLIGATLIGLFLGLKKFKSIPMTGSWFRWKSVLYSGIMLFDFWVIYRALKGDVLVGMIRLMMARLTVLMEVWYCHHWQFQRDTPQWWYYGKVKTWLVVFMKKRRKCLKKTANLILLRGYEDRTDK